MIALVTDSNAQLPEQLRRRWKAQVVPLTVVVDGEPYREGLDLDCTAFYRRLAGGAQVSTAAPSPGEFAKAYSAAAAGGASVVLSIHIGSELSGTCNSARLAAATAPIPVEVVDSGTASFALGCCVWGAAEAVATGSSVAEASEAARLVAARVGNVFIVSATELAARSGRLDPDPTSTTGFPVLALEGGKMRVLGEVVDIPAAVDTMAAYVHSGGRGLRVGVGDADVPQPAEQLAQQLMRAPEVAEVVRYQVGPSVAAHTGLGTFGAVYF